MTRLTIAFDNDGTLIDTHDFYTRMNNELGRKYDLPFMLAPDISRTFSREGYWQCMRKNGVKDAMVQLMLDEIEPRIKEHLKQVLFFEGMPELFRTLSEDHDIYVVTDARESWLKELYERVELAPRAVYGLERGPHKKERLKTVRELHPTQTPIYVCDTTSDCRAATGEGYKVIAVTWGFHPENWLLEENPDFLARTTQEVREGLDVIARNGHK